MTDLGWFGLGCAVFVSALSYDLAWAKYLRAAADRKALRAAAWSVTTYVIGLVGFFGVLQLSVWLAIPEAAGLFVGTSIGVARGRP